MKINFLQRLFPVAAILAMCATAQEPVKPQLSPRIITATRQVTIFSSLEKQLLQNVQKKDKAAIQALLSDDLLIFMPNADAMPGEDWTASVISRDFVLKAFGIRQVSALDLGDSVLVSFDRAQESTYQGKPDGGEFFVIDLWKKNSDSWKLASRYVSKVGTTTVMPKEPVKPTGKQ